MFCQVEKELLKAVANVQEIFSSTIFFGDRLTIRV